ILVALALRILSAVQYLRASSACLPTLCLMIVDERFFFEKRFHASRYTPTNKQRRIAPTRGSWMNLYRRDILALSFMKDGMNRKPVQGIVHVVFPSALPRIRIAFPILISI